MRYRGRRALRRLTSRRSVRVTFIGTAPLLIVACSGNPASTLDPAGPGARRVEGLWWLLFWISCLVFAVVMVGLGWALLRRRRTSGIGRGDAIRFVIVTGAVIPFVVLTGAYAVGLRDMTALSDAPSDDGASDSPLTVEVISHQWWWEVRYPATGAVTANEIHIPAGSTVRVRLRTADVVHSFWVPRLMSKTDAISGRVNTLWLRADEPGRYRGVCAEYCGLQHANMGFLVVAQEASEFSTWLNRLTIPAPAPDTDAERRGMRAFLTTGCAACHTVRGTPADGTVGPDLSSIGSRWSIGAGAAPNDRGHLGGWVVDPQTIKPGSKMPPQPVAGSELPDLITYLQSLE